MIHFEIGEWTDYIHSFITGSARETMERHLADCAACRRVTDLLGRVQAEASAEPVAPENLVLAAKALFRPATEQTSSWLSLPRLAAQLVFNGLAGPPLEGARAAASADVQVVYRAGDCIIDLQMERDPESSAVALVGQLADCSRSRAPLSGIPVVLTAGTRVIARGESNRFGEFCLEGRALRRLTLRVALECAGKQIVIALGDFVEEGH